MMPYFERQLPLLGREGQEKLGNASLLVAGVGGLGTNVAMQLIRTGIGTLHIVDKGILDAPDLNRQILYHQKDIGRKKVDVAMERLHPIDMQTKIIPHFQTINENFQLPEGICGVVDCMDNFEARYILDDLVHEKGKFFVHAGIHSLIGQVTTIWPGKTRSLRELFAGMDPGQDTPIPVIGAVPSIIASLQVVETTKLICDLDNNLINKILYMDLGDYSFRIIDL
ncbi:MAG: HesA/MoeB/ThiF family protein [bacterium]|nr:HesA/MoeB/ThiF family protein [bacterium]